MRRALFALIVPLVIGLGAAPAAAAVVRTIEPSNAPTGTHFSRGDAVCTVDGTTVSCSSYQLAGVGNANASAELVANYTATIDCFNPGSNPNNPIESHTTSFSDEQSSGTLSPKNGKLTVGSLTASPNTSLGDVLLCPNPKWEPRIREGSLTLQSFTYTLSFEGFGGPFITITGP